MLSQAPGKARTITRTPPLSLPEEIKWFSVTPGYSNPWFIYFLQGSGMFGSCNTWIWRRIGFFPTCLVTRRYRGAGAARSHRKRLGHHDTVLLTLVIKVSHQCFPNNVFQTQITGRICKGVTPRTDCTWERRENTGKGGKGGKKRISEKLKRGVEKDLVILLFLMVQQTSFLVGY